MLRWTAIAIAIQKLILQLLQTTQSVSEVDGSEFFNQESFDELGEEELGTKGDWDDDDESIDDNNVLICLVWTIWS